MGRQLCREGLRETDHTGTDRIGQNQSFYGLFDCYGRHIDDAPPSFFLHYRNGLARHGNSAHQIEFESELPEVIIYLQEGNRRRTACVIHQDIDGTVMFNRLPDKLPGLSYIRQIGRDGQDLSACLLFYILRSPGKIRIIKRANGNPGAFLCKFSSHSLT